MSWSAFAAVFVAFFVTHSIPVRPAVKSRIVGRIGAAGFGMAYSALSIAMLALLVWAAGQAPFEVLWPQMPWHRNAVHLGMLAVCLLLALSLGRPNPFSFGGARNDDFDPARAGVVRWSRHPVLLALALWAGLHLLPNGDLAHVILFGTLGGFAVIGRLLIDRRKQRVMGVDRWQALRDATRTAPRFYRPRSWLELVMRLAAGVAAFATLLWLHPVVIGVSAL
ncbi:putative membrane protein [Litoreibacter meonggei]|uniref:Putative membrane protein n=1 Tax=Litoreibacter meonggei TaxID=1049199 RepID=A0A497X138_9RHOB|nr:NnrU family protein [Litoreibacter meonggei]RLJ59195.1 putative membrane protein [Litoreibacter meonggei]